MLCAQLLLLASVWDTVHCALHHMIVEPMRPLSLAMEALRGYVNAGLCGGGHLLSLCELFQEVPSISSGT